MGVTSTTNGATASCTLITNGGPIFIWYNLADASTGTFTYKVDTGATSSNINSYTTPATATQNGGATGMGLLVVTGLSAGSHTVLFTDTGATGQAVGIWAIGTTPPTGTSTQQEVLDAGVIKELNDANSTASAAYDADAKADVTLLAGYGLPIVSKDVRSYMQTYCPGSTSACMNDTYHPNDAGHKLVRRAMEQNFAFPYAQYPTTVLNNVPYLNANPTSTFSTTNLNSGLLVYNNGTTNLYGMDMGWDATSGYSTRIFSGGFITFGGFANNPTGQRSFTPGMTLTTAGFLGVGVKNPGSPVSVNGGLSAGTGYATTAAPSNGAIIQGAVGIGTNAPNAGVALDLGSNTNSMLLPSGTTGQRPGTGIAGMLRYNSTTPGLESYLNSQWTSVATGTETGNGIYVGANPISGATAEYPLIDGSGTTISDLSGNGNTGTFCSGANAPTWTTYGINFAGSQCISTPITTWRTVLVHVCPITTVGQGTAYAVPVGSPTTGLDIFSAVPGPSISNSSTMAINPGIWKTSTSAFTTETVLGDVPPQPCSVLALTLDTNDHFYVNGIERKYTAQSASFSSVTGTYYLGGEGTSSSKTFDGTIDYAVFYPSVLTLSQVQQETNYINSKVLSRAGFPLWYPYATNQSQANQMICIGDSLTVGNQGSAWCNSTYMSLNNTYTFNINAYGGRFSTDVASSVQKEAVPYISAAGGKNVCNVWLGTNNFAQTSGAFSATSV